MWLEHLKTIDANRKQGAIKAAETRRRKQKGNKQSENFLRQTEADVAQTADADDGVQYFCGLCDAMYGNTDEVEYWICCDGCEQ